MATQLPETFEPEKEEGNNLLPKGEYNAQIVEISVMQPKSMDGYYILAVWKILDGDYENRQVWQRITFTHSNEQARTIGRKMLKDLCAALGVDEHVEDVDVFLFKPAKIKVDIEEGTGGYDDQNKVKRILPPDPLTNGAGASQPAPRPAPQTDAAAVATPKQPQAATQGPARPGPAGSAPWHQQKS